MVDVAPQPAKNSGDRLLDLLATGFYSGYSPVAPGTAGTGVILLICIGIEFNSPGFFLTTSAWVLAGLVTLLGVIVSTQALRRNLYAGRKEHDPGQIVIDEFAGFLVTIAGVGLGGVNVILSFLAFRFFDVLKPYPVKRFERLPEGWGIMLDDVVAGVFANIVLRILAVVL